MGFITENGPLGIIAWSLVMLLVGFAIGFGRGKAGAASDDRGRLDRLPPAVAMPAPTPGRPDFRAAGPAALAPEALSRIHDALRAGNKIQAIKIMREETGLGLAEAKNAVEAM